MHTVLGTASLPARDILFMLPYPVIVLSADKLRKWIVRLHESADNPERRHQ